MIKKIRATLTQFAANVTGKKRYQPQIEWSSKCWTHNVFRAYEWLFGREYGIRREFAIEQVKENGEYKTYRYFFTKEAAIAHFEGVVRSFVKEFFSAKKWSFDKVEVFVPAFGGEASGMFNAFGGQYVFAIARNDTENEAGASGSATRTAQMTITGSDRLLTFFPYNDVNTRTVSAKTYDSVDFGTVIAQNNGTNGSMRTYMLEAPSTTTNASLSITYNSATYIALGAIAYTGCAQTGQVRTSGVNVINSSGTSITASITVAVADSWIAGRARFDNAGTVSASNDFAYVSASANGLAVLDSNTTVATGSRTVGASCTAAGNRWLNSVEVNVVVADTFLPQAVFFE